jgi:ADP-ribosylglycohydrolase
MSQMALAYNDPDPYMHGVVGSFVADAATMGLHWIYDPLEIQRLVETSDPAFFEPPSSPYYQYRSGELSPYGAEALGVIHSLGSKADVSGQELTSDFVDFMKKYKGYKNKASRFLIENFDAGKKFPESGADDGQANALVKIPVAVARYSGRPDFLEKVEETIRAHQNNDLAVRCGVAAAAILDRIARGATVPDALRWSVGPASPIDAVTKQQMRDAEAALPPTASAADAARAFGASCALPGALLTALHVLRTARGFSAAVRANALAGGDQCSRGAFIGACFAAADPAAIPDEWMAKVGAPSRPCIESMRMSLDPEHSTNRRINRVAPTLDRNRPPPIRGAGEGYWRAAEPPGKIEWGGWR